MARAPSTDWQEDVEPDEDERFERHAETLREIQRKANAKSGPGRALHRKMHVGVEAEFELRDGLPAEARQGLFAQPAKYRAYVRFSNGTQIRQSDSRPDLRGVAIKLLGVPGRKLIPGLEDATTQDFSLINTPSTPFEHVDGFMKFVEAVQNPALAPVRLLAAFGPLKTLSLLRHAAATLKRPPSLATIDYFSAVPVKWGDYAAKYRLSPAGAEAGGGPKGEGRNALRDELAGRLAAGPLRFTFAAQLYRDPQSTAIEDASAVWGEEDAPFVDVADLVIAQQDVDSDRGRELGELIEKLSFDPWHALEAHRPLGNIMRARSHAYRLSTIERGAAPEPEGSETIA